MSLPALLLFVCATLTRAGYVVTGTVDLTSTGLPFEHYWKRCVGSGHMLLGTREDWRRHLKLAVDELGFTGIRGHGLLDDDMSLLPSRGGDYEFYNVDQVYDYLVSLKIKPVVELSFMPKALVTCGTSGAPTCAYAFGNPGGYKGLTMPPDDFEDWYNMVAALAKHLVARYGIEEVSTWHFEVWNEMWGIEYPEPYLSLYNASARAIKDVSPSLKVGGPATMQTLDVGEFIKAVKGKVPVDFVSTHFYPTDPQCQTEDTKNDPDCFAHTVLAAQHLAKEAGLPFFITEYNNGLDQTSRDDSSAAAFVFRHIGLMDALDMFSWWTFTDIFEEGWMLSDPFHNGFGMMTVHGIRKPVWRAFQMLANAGDTRLPVSGFVSPDDGASDISVLATRSSKQSADVQLFVANYHRLGDATRYSCDEASGQCKQDDTGSFTDEVLCNANCRSENTRRRLNDESWRNVTLIILHSVHEAKSLPSAVSGVRIDAEHANPLAQWKDLGSPKYPTSEDLSSLEAASKVGVPEKIAMVHLNATSSAISFLMPPNSVMHIKFGGSPFRIVL